MQFPRGVQTFVCPTCGEQRSGLRRRCYACTGHRPDADERERVRRKLTGVHHSEERRRRNAEGHTGAVNRFDIASVTRGLPAHNRKKVGSTRVGNGHVQIKCPDGKWRYRARVVWEQANGPIPRGKLIHHVNHDPFDDRPENLQLVTRAEHARIHLEEDGRAAAIGALGLRSRYGR